MKFGKRLRFYLFGITIGLFVSAMFFGDRGCSFLPGEQVLLGFRNSEIELTEDAACLFACQNISKKDLYTLFDKSVGDVNFGESMPRETPKIYMLEGTVDTKELKISLSITEDSIARVLSVENSEGCSCSGNDTTEIVTVYQTNQYALNLLNGRNMAMSQDVQTQLEGNGLDKSTVFQVFKEGKVLFDKSDLLATPNRIYVVSGVIKDKEYTLTFELGEVTRLLAIE